MSKNKLIIFVVFLLVEIILFYYAYFEKLIPVKDETDILIYAIVYILLVIILIISVNKLKVYSFPSLFLFGTLAFGPASFALVYFLGSEGYNPSWKVKDSFIYLVSTNHYMLAFTSFLLGSLVSKPKSFKLRIPFKKVNRNSLRVLGLLLFCYSILVILLSNFTGYGIVAMVNSNYGDLATQTRSGNISPFILTAYNWFLPWSVLILLVTSNTFFELRKSALFFLTPALIVLFLIGDRTAPFFLIGVSIGVFYLKNKMNFNPNFIRISILGLLLLLLIPLIKNTRTYPITSWNTKIITASILGNPEGYNKHNFAVEAFIETSFQAQCLPGTLLLVPEKESFRYGYDFIKSLYYAVPLLSQIFHPKKLGFYGRGPGIHTKPTAWFTYYYNRDGVAGFAYSQIAEAYLQFGVFGIIILYLILGYYLTSKWKSFENFRFKDEDLLFFLFIFLTVITWIRNDSGSLFRNIFYGFLFTYIFPVIVDLIFSKKVERTK